MDDIYLVGAPDKMPGVITSLQQKNLGSLNLNTNINKSLGHKGMLEITECQHRTQSHEGTSCHW